MALVEFSIERQGMDTILLDSDGGGPFGLQARTSGLGVGPIVPRFRSGSADGDEYDGERVGGKPVDLGIIVLGDDRLSTGDLIRRLANTVRSRRNRPAPVLVARYATGEIFDLPFRYLGGLEIEHEEALPEIFKTTLSLMCPLPYWVDRKAQQISVRLAGDSRPFLPLLSHLQVGSSSAIGDVIVNNIGDVEAPTVTRITGPGGPTSFSIAGEGYVFEEVLLEGEVITINTATNEVTDQTGANRYDGLAEAPRFPSLPDGRTLVSMAMDGASPGHLEPTTTVLHQNRATEPALRTGRTTWSTWAEGAATETHPTTGFDGSTDGYLQLAWTVASSPVAQIGHTFAAVEGEVVSASIQVLSSKARRVNPVFSCFDATGRLLLSIYGESVEMPAQTVVTIGVDGSVIGALPTDTASCSITASVDATDDVQWQPGDTFRASRACVVDGDDLVKYFDGSRPDCAWLGTADASASVEFLLERVGFSEISMFYQPRREVVY